MGVWAVWEPYRPTDFRIDIQISYIPLYNLSMVRLVGTKLATERPCFFGIPSHVVVDAAAAMCWSRFRIHHCTCGAPASESWYHCLIKLMDIFYFSEGFFLIWFGWKTCGKNTTWASIPKPSCWITAGAPRTNGSCKSSSSCLAACRNSHHGPAKVAVQSGWDQPVGSTINPNISLGSPTCLAPYYRHLKQLLGSASWHTNYEKHDTNNRQSAKVSIRYGPVRGPYMLRKNLNQKTTESYCYWWKKSGDHHLGCIKPPVNNGIFQLVSWISEPSTVSWIINNDHIYWIYFKTAGLIINH